MFLRNKLFFTAIVTILFLSIPAIAQKKNSNKPILWEKVDVSKQELFYGPGGKAMQPNVERITFIKEETGGSSKKFRLKDADGKEWVAKVGNEAQPETAAVRLIWALGYKTEIVYLVPKLTIPGQGEFKNVRFEARPDNIDREGRWSWKNNEFNNSEQFIGLKVMMAMLNNWDLKDEGNNIVLEVKNSNGKKETHYAISDLGATFGRTGYVNLPLIWRFGRHKNRPSDYSKSKFIDRVNKKGEIEFSYAGRNPKLFDNIKVEQTRFITDQLSQLSDKQIYDAFRAANYSPTDMNTLAQAFKRKIGELKKIQ